MNAFRSFICLIAICITFLFSVASAQADQVDEWIAKAQSEESSTWVSAIYDLKKTGDARAVAALIEILQKSPNRGKRGYAAGALGEMRVPRAIELLLNALDDPEGSVREGAAKGLGHYGDPRMLEPLLKALSDKDSSVRSSAASSLGMIRDQRAVGPLIGALKDESEYVRREAAEALGELGAQQAVKPLIEALRDKGDDVRQNAAEALGKLNDRRAVEPLIDTLTDKNNLVRSNAAAALNKLNDPRAIEPMIKTLDDPFWPVRFNALKFLCKHLSPRLVEPLIRALKDNDSTSRKMAAEALGKLNDPRAVPPLIEALKDKDFGVKVTAAEALGKLNDQRAVAPLTEALKDKGLEWSAGQALRALKDSEEKQRPREGFNRYLAEFQKAYWSTDLRKKVIAFANMLTPPPAIPEEARSQFIRGNATFKAARNQKDYSTAEQYLNRASNLAPWWPDAYYNLAVVQEKLNNYSGAIDSLELYLMASPNSQDEEAIKTKIAELQFAKENHEKAIKIVQTLGGIDQKDILADRYKYISKFTEASRADPRWGYPHVMLGWIYVMVEDWQKVVAENEEALRLGNTGGLGSFSEIFLYNNLAVGYEHLGNIDKAILTLEDGLNIEPHGFGSAYAHKNLGQYYKTKGNYEKALQNYMSAKNQIKPFADPKSEYDARTIKDIEQNIKQLQEFLRK